MGSVKRILPNDDLSTILVFYDWDAALTKIVIAIDCRVRLPFDGETYIIIFFTGDVNEP